MRRILLLITCITMGPLFACGIAHAQIADVQIDFGNVTEARLGHGEKKAVLKNEADHAVVVDKVTAGCGCVQVEWVAPRKIAAGESVEIVVRLRASEVRAGAFAYPVVAEVDGVQVKVGEVRYEYQPLVDPGQRSIWLESVDGLTNLRGHFPILTTAEIKLDDVTVVAPGYIKVEVARQSAQTAEVLLTYRDDKPLREREFDVLLKVAGSADEPFRLTVHVPALDLVALDPGAVLIPQIKTGAVVTRSIRLQALTDQPLKADALEVVSDDARVKGAVREADGAVWVDVAIAPERAGVDSATLELRDRARTWAVPINVTWRSHD